MLSVIDFLHLHTSVSNSEEGEERGSKRRGEAGAYVGGDFRATEQPDSLEIPVTGGAVDVHGAKGILVELLQSLEVPTNEVVDFERLRFQLPIVFVLCPEEGITCNIIETTEKRKISEVRWERT